MGYLILETGETYKGIFHGGTSRAGEVVFNTSHCGYQEMSTDPSYFSQILVTTAPMQGNYGVHSNFVESENTWIEGFVCLEMQSSSRDKSWEDKLTGDGVPILSEVNTRELVLTLRSQGTTWGAIVDEENIDAAKEKAMSLIATKKQNDKDWVAQTTSREAWEKTGSDPKGPRVAILDLGSKKNILRELEARCSALKVFPSTAKPEEIQAWNPDGLMLTNGPGDPQDVQQATQTVKDLLGKTCIFGICMGHHILSRAVGGETYKLKFGHRGSNHPIRDEILGRVYMTSQNHGYAVDGNTLPREVEITHTNLNDDTVAGIQNVSEGYFSVQFHPESHPGPRDAAGLFDVFIKRIHEYQRSH